LSIEYLIAKDMLQWITITSEQAVCMSMCLQGMVDQLMQKRETGSAKWIHRRTSGVKKQLNNGFYMRRDGSTLFESPLAQSLGGEAWSGGEAGEEGRDFGSEAVSISRSQEPDRLTPNGGFADRVQQVLAGRVTRSASESRLASVSSGTHPLSSSTSSNPSNGTPGRKMTTSATLPPNGFSMAYRHSSSIAENDAFDGIREDDL
jgi:hypothetical protein